MNILAFDPGDTVGIAVLIDGNWVLGMTVPHKELNEVIFRSLVMIGNPHVVVVEELPMGTVHLNTTAVHNLIDRWFRTAGYTIDKVSPGLWKGMVERQTISGTHQVDAATMGLWYHRSRLVNVFRE